MAELACFYLVVANSLKLSGEFVICRPRFCSGAGLKGTMDSVKLV